MRNERSLLREYGGGRFLNLRGDQRADERRAASDQDEAVAIEHPPTRGGHGDAPDLIGARRGGIALAFDELDFGQARNERGQRERYREDEDD
ncbi:MAG: hypothetical protein ACLPYS_15190 [Vulcanimicrobiaceae bacterium]